MVRFVWLHQNVLKLGRTLDHFLCIRTHRFDLQTVRTRVFDGGLDHIFANAFAAELFIDLGVIDGHYAVGFEVCELSDPFAILVDEKCAFPPVFVSLNLHSSSITTNSRQVFHHFVRMAA